MRLQAAVLIFTLSAHLLPLILVRSKLERDLRWGGVRMGFPSSGVI